MGTMPALADAQAIALATGRAPSTIRAWASKGWLARRGTDPRGRVLYDITEARKLAERLDAQLSQEQLDNHAHQREH
jgi:hypothetical protein